MVDHSRQDQHRNPEKTSDGGLLKKPLSGSFRRIRDQFERETTEKTPSRAIRDDIGGSAEPTDKEWSNLEGRVDEVRARRRSS